MQCGETSEIAKQRERDVMKVRRIEIKVNDENNRRSEKGAGARVSLNNLSDLQKTYLTQLSYLDINTLGKRKADKSGIKVSNLIPFLSNPHMPFCGSAMMAKEAFDKMAIPFIGDYKLQTDKELLAYIIDLGLGDLNVIGVESDAKSGFQAMAFRDREGNIGISFRGSDLDFSNGALMDWIEADFLEYFTNDSVQRRRALNFFNLHKSVHGNNFLYGHSLGGNLASHVYSEYYNEITAVFIINGYPINQVLLNTTEKISAFNNKKYSFNSICGDIVSHLKSCEMYQNNIRYVKNNGTIKASLLSAHLPQSASFTTLGEFSLTTKDEAIKHLGKMNAESVKLAQNIRETLNELEKRFECSKVLAETSINRYREELVGKIDQLKIQKQTIIAKTLNVANNPNNTNTPKKS